MSPIRIRGPGTGLSLERWEGGARAPLLSVGHLVELLTRRSLPLLLCLGLGVLMPGLLRWTSGAGLLVFGLSQLAKSFESHSVWLQRLRGLLLLSAFVAALFLALAGFPFAVAAALLFAAMAAFVAPARTFSERLILSCVAGACCVTTLIALPRDSDWLSLVAFVLAGLWLSSLLRCDHLRGRTAPRRPEPSEVAVVCGAWACVVLLLSSTALFSPEGGARSGDRGPRQNDRLTGFSDEIVLGEFGRLENDDRLALKVRVVGPQSREWTHEEGEVSRLPSLLLRGAALEVFGERRLTRAAERIAFEPPIQWRDPSEMIRQDIVALPSQGQELFGMATPERVFGPVDLAFGFCRKATQSLAPIEYSVHSIVWEARIDALPQALRVAEAPEVLRDLPLHLKSSLAPLAGQFEAYEPRAVLRRVRAVETWLKRDGGFSYTRRDQNLGDWPLLRFIEETRAGHCEYFAAAMVAVLRASGLPARVAVGYRGGTYDPREGHYRVLRRHAHAWVEVPFEGYGWLSFDPTPGDDRLDAANGTSVFGGLAASDESSAAPLALEAEAPAAQGKRFFPLLIAALAMTAFACWWGQRRRRRRTRALGVGGPSGRLTWARYREALARRVQSAKPSETLGELSQGLSDGEAEAEGPVIFALNRERFGPRRAEAPEALLKDLVERSIARLRARTVQAPLKRGSRPSASRR